MIQPALPKVLVIAVREYRAIVATKAFLLALTLMPVLMFGGIFIQNALQKRTGPAEKRIAVYDSSGVLFDDLQKAAEQRNAQTITDLKTGRQTAPRYLLQAGPGTLDEAKRFELSEQIRARKLDAFVEIPATVVQISDGAPASIALYAENAALAEEKNWLQQTLGDLVRVRRMKQLGLDPAVVGRATAPVMVEPFGLVQRNQAGELTSPERSGVQAVIFLPFGMMMLMFMVIFLAAQPMLESVLEEKSQRIAEVLLGSANAFQIMLGKLLGGVGGSLTIVAIYGAAGYAVTWYYGLTHLVPLRLVPWFLVYQVLAVFLFGSIFLAIGAAVNQFKEAQGLLLPVWLVKVFPLFIWLPVVRDPTGGFATWLSFVPTATPLLMMLRMAASASIPLWQPLLGICVMIAFTLLCVLAAARVFRIGILAQGKSAAWGEMLRWAIQG